MSAHLAALPAEVRFLARAGVIVLSLLGIPACRGGASQTAPVTLRPRVVASHPHDRMGYCQGLVVTAGGAFYESTGHYGKSTLRKVDIATGRVLKIEKLPDELFAEGIAVVGDRILQLTWQENVVLFWEETEKGFTKVDERPYPFEGWGLAYDGKMLVASDGTETLRVLDPESLEVERVMRVLDGDVPVSSLNELEFVRGEIFANVWKADKIVRIDPGSGRVLGWIDLRSLRREVEWSPLLDVLNGIAWNPRQDRLYVTGKNWSKVFEIELVRE